ncbi:JAB domain-containing protein [Sphingobium sp. HWE2-09]|uniref:JAB domain-containing protein n=1 Tax=Sphingobium sp. HWE2-09 TaxID=3108390 RepID=UPI002DD2D102|nr:JAB domain-containing protein [Sphingobium sp. HWE2-09]
MAARLRSAPLEECHFLFYSGNKPVGHQWFAGEHDRVEINTREMFHHALNQGATRMTIAHNHPSGNPSPSRTDVQFTTHISSIGKALRVLAFDHVIFARDRHFSFRSEGLM